MQYKELIIHTDGGARGNPGPAGIGFTIYDEVQKPVLKFGKAIGVASNNEAEYTALIEALTHAVPFGKKAEVTVFSDSELMVSQLKGIYKIKVPKLKELSDKVKDLAQNFKKVSYTHVRREKNKEADFLVNEALDGRPVHDVSPSVGKDTIKEFDHDAHNIPQHAIKAFSGVIFDIYQWEQELFDGTKTLYERAVKNDSVTVIPVTKDKKIIVTYQEQPACDPFITVAGGRCEENEPCEVSAKRELLEETGYKTDTLLLIEEHSFPGDVESKQFVYIARDCVKVNEMTPDSGEKIIVKLVSLDEFIEIVKLPEFREVEVKLWLYEILLSENGREILEKKLFGE